MPVLNRNQVLAICYAQGFRGKNLALAVAIAQGESGFRTDATNSNNNGSIDRGLFQINSVHSQYNSTRLFDPVYNTNAAWNISSNGTNWNPWVAYTNGRYRQFYDPQDEYYRGLPGTGAPAPDDPVNQPEPKRGVEAVRQYMVPGYTDFSGWGAARPGTTGSHAGEDLMAPRGTHAYAPEPMTITNNYFDNFGGNALYAEGDSGLHWYFAHFDRKPAWKIGTKINVGDVLGPIGSTNGYGAVFVPHLHYQVGRNGNWANPTTVLADFVVFGTNIPGQLPQQPVYGSTGPLPSYGQISDAIHQTLIEMPGFAGLALALDQAEGFYGIPGYQDQRSIPDKLVDPMDVGGRMQYGLNVIFGNTIPVFVRGTFVVLGLILFIGLSFNFLRQQASELAPVAARFAAARAGIPV